MGWGDGSADNVQAGELRKGALIPQNPSKTGRTWRPPIIRVWEVEFLRHAAELAESGRFNK